MSIATVIDQRAEHYSLDELKQTAGSIAQLISKFPFLSGELRAKFRFYKQGLDACRNEDDLYGLLQEFLADFEDPQPASLGVIMHEMTQSWATRLALKKLGLKRGNDPMVFMRRKLYEQLNKIGFAEGLVWEARESVGIAF